MNSPRFNPLTWCCIAAIRLYQWTLSPLVGRHCRFQPTCSGYAEEAFRRFGVIKGARLTIVRLSRCHPWGGAGWDPVPMDAQSLEEDRP